MSKVDENKLQKKNSLLQTAFELFTTKGVSKTSISDIVQNAGVAKGTFYLYFKDKIDIRNKLTAHKTEKLFEKALEALEKSPTDTFADKVIFVIDHIIDQLSENPTLLVFIYKNLSWGVFRNLVNEESLNPDSEFHNVYDKIISEDFIHFDDPEIMIYMIIEFVSSASYSSILYNEPISIEELKPHIHDTIRLIIKKYEKKL